MTVNEVEARTGLDRGTVRFYESEGLISPKREANGYRNYTDADVEKLEKVKLLRSLRFSLDDIKAMDADGGDFSDRLRARIKSLDAAEADIADAKRVLERMLRENARYETLDAKTYLGAMEEKKELTAGPAEIAEDTESEGTSEEEQIVSPWRRYFARAFDLGLYYLLITALVCDVFNVSYVKLINLPHLGVWMTVFSIAATLLFEPLALHFFGTTPGKLIMGLRVTGREGNKLSWNAALLRTLEVLVIGQGLMIPVVSFILYIWSFVKARRGDELFWEDESRLEQRGQVAVRAAVLIGGWTALIGLEVLALVAPAFLPNRGAVTPEELSENYNKLVGFYGLNEYWSLQPDGSWVDTTPKPVSGGVIHEVSPTADPPERVEYTLEDGAITALHFVRRGSDKGGFWSLDPVYFEARLLSMSLIGADNGLLGYVRVQNAIARQGMTEFDATVGRWRAYLKVTTNGQLMQSESMIFGDDDVWWIAELVVEKVK